MAVTKTTFIIFSGITLPNKDNIVIWLFNAHLKLVNICSYYINIVLCYCHRILNIKQLNQKLRINCFDS